MEKYKLYEAEYKFMCILWEEEPVNSTQLAKILLEKYQWKKSTVFNLMKKLGQRGLVKNENAVVTAPIKREQVQQYESRELIEKTFNGSLPGFLAAFLGDKRLSEKEAEELKKIIEEAVK